MVHAFPALSPAPCPEHKANHGEKSMPSLAMDTKHTVSDDRTIHSERITQIGIHVVLIRWHRPLLTAAFTTTRLAKILQLHRVWGVGCCKLLHLFQRLHPACLRPVCP
uniref:Uncharacterized protein n=1 Tax=Eutreptiella gymnastica TaxID=73025 RepID=A0A7S1NK74_9EUGL